MKRIFRTVAAVILCMALVVPAVDARGRNDRGNQGGQSHGQTLSRPGNMGRPSNAGGSHGNNRPNNGGNPSNNRTNNGGNPGNNRPGNNPGNNRPGNNPGNNRPGNNPGNHNPGNQPGGNHNNGNHNPNHGRPNNNFGNHNPGVTAPPRPGNSFHGHGPYRPNVPPQYGWHRPTPPRNWRPAPGWRPFHSILGVALGSAINFTVQALIGNGYNVVSYGPSGVWVENVPMLNLMWPNAQLFYNNAGGLCGSRFVYSTAYDDWNRYNMVYTLLTNTYGMPVSQNNSASGVTVTWWGTGNQFVSLSYDAEYSPAGALRYYTTLSFGN